MKNRRKKIPRFLISRKIQLQAIAGAGGPGYPVTSAGPRKCRTSRARTSTSRPGSTLPRELTSAR
ncbi:uncharacterized protein LOC107272861 isoform X3 [Cephus cinctus]|uniref:Uncharacterized protein LOC107272861 isoform X3 n=1 Tax=Cephus cinctus TaxID=211228 RepID=A0AAJ7FSF6_CEPCN|nr:uncharacterized protein LOC107272861 isoform X3 [Cephus cinctus]